MLPQLLSGARGVISYKLADGTVKILATALDVNINVAEGQQQTFVLGSYNAPSIDPTGIDVTGSVSRVIPVNLPASASQVSPDLSAIDLGLQQQIQNVLISQAVDVTLTDRITDKVMGSIREARFSGSALNEGAQSVATQRISFVGIWDAGYNGTEQVASLLGYSSANA